MVQQSSFKLTISSPWCFLSDTKWSYLPKLLIGRNESMKQASRATLKSTRMYLVIVGTQNYIHENPIIRITKSRQISNKNGEK